MLVEAAVGRGRVFKTKKFDRFASKERIEDAVLLQAVRRAESGSIDADLGGGVLKQRVARPGEGKSGGYRTLIVFRSGDRAVFIHGFAKGSQENITALEKRELKAAAKWILKMTQGHLDALVVSGEFIEVKKP
jgi:hypothetical protein